MSTEKAWATRDKNRMLAVHIKDKPSIYAHGGDWTSWLYCVHFPKKAEREIRKALKGIPWNKAIIEVDPETWIPIK